VVVVGVVAFVGLGWVADLPEAAGPAFFAVFTLGAQADFGGTPRRRAVRYLLTGAISGGMLLLAAALEDHPPLVVAATGVVVFTTMFLGTLGGPFYSARFPVVIAFLYGATTVATGSAMQDRLLGWAVGAVAVTVGSLVLWPERDLSEVPALVADVLRRAAAVVGGPASPPERAQLLDASHRLRIAANAEHLHAGAVATDERRRAELVHATERLAAAGAVATPPTADADDRALIGATVDALARCADDVARSASDPAPAPNRASALQAAIDDHAVRRAAVLAPSHAGPDADAAVRAGMMATDVRIVARTALTVADLVDGQPVGAPAPDARTADAIDDRPDTALRAQLHFRSLWLRNALRAAVALMIAMALILEGVGQDHGFWVALGAFAVLRADLVTIGHSAWRIILGTAIGFVVSSGIVLAADDVHAILWVAFVVALYVAALGDRVRPEIGAAGFTVLLVAIYTLVEPAGLRTGELRLANVSIGAAITFGVTLVLWPRPGRAPGRVIADVVDRARLELARAITGSPPERPLAVMADLDRVLDVASTSAPRAISDDTRARVLVTVDVTANLADLLTDTTATAPIALAPVVAAPRLHDALATDAARVDATLTGLVARLAHHDAPPPAPVPDALVARLVDTLQPTDASAVTDPGVVSAGIRIASAFALVDRLARAQAPATTGTLE